MIQQDDRYRDLEGSRAAMIRAARRAAEVARQHQQPLILWRDGRIVEVMPDDLPPLPEQAPRKTEADIDPQADRQSACDRAQELAWDAMEASDEEQMARLCRQALAIYPNCVDALSMLAEVECERVRDYVAAMRRAVEAGRRDLGPEVFEQEKGHFWLAIETRPFMRAMAGLADALLQWGQPEHVDEAIAIYEEMLELNPNDNQGIRYLLPGCYLQRKRYREAAILLDEHGDEGMAALAWARVLLAYAVGNEDEASDLLKEAREQNPYVELYLTGRKRRPRTRTDYYSPGDDTEALVCADALWEAWKKHPKAKRWLKEQCEAQ
ncbi:MAG: tetratricopeptide repeat protein [Phycisphaeraceae bacterium]